MIRLRSLMRGGRKETLVLDGTTHPTDMSIGSDTKVQAHIGAIVYNIIIMCGAFVLHGVATASSIRQRCKGTADGRSAWLVV